MTEKIDLKIKTNPELKEIAYDHLVIIQNAQNAVNLISAELESRSKDI